MMIELVNQVASLLYQPNAIVRFICLPRLGNVEDVVVCDLSVNVLPPVIKAGIAASLHQRMNTYDEERERDGSIRIAIDWRLVAIMDDIRDTARELLSGMDDILSQENEQVLDSIIESFQDAYNDLVLSSTPRMTELCNAHTGGIITTTLRCELPPC